MEENRNFIKLYEILSFIGLKEIERNKISFLFKNNISEAKSNMFYEITHNDEMYLLIEDIDSTLNTVKLGIVKNNLLYVEWKVNRRFNHEDFNWNLFYGKLDETFKWKRKYKIEQLLNENR